MIWYCDTSALLKRYVRETGSQWFRQEQDNHRLLISEIAIVEISAALARRMRDGTISTFEGYRDRGQFLRHVRAGMYALLSPSLEIIERASTLCYRQPLAAYDAIHLATVLSYSENNDLDRADFCFVTADNQLQRAAEAEGLETENPNTHP